MENLSISKHSSKKKLFIWTLAWVITVALATFGPTFIWPGVHGLTLTAILFNLVTGFGLILANREYLFRLDELQQKIQLEAMALALGAGVVGGIGYSLLDHTNLIPVDAEISILVIWISLVYLAGLLWGHLRYR